MIHIIKYRMINYCIIKAKNRAHVAVLTHADPLIPHLGRYQAWEDNAQALCASALYRCICYSSKRERVVSRSRGQLPTIDYVPVVKQYYIGKRRDESRNAPNFLAWY
jgi:hypothetical protein